MRRSTSPIPLRTLINCSIKLSADKQCAVCGYSLSKCVPAVWRAPYKSQTYKSFRLSRADVVYLTYAYSCDDYSEGGWDAAGHRHRLAVQGHAEHAATYGCDDVVHL
ncbi:hypothetical protein B5X24_HaOG202072 [Helicoverpa armigera]|uniref:Uncharacterized protein n=1 Tax=Helicoverpa armigera TaxID=29058 RepID=A0A2W1C0L6_HELAM|nr:hypothetical protein B5X24_HaOG202072 [Helicoverpa armigera]